MKKLLITGILLSLCIQQFIIPMNIVNAANPEQKTWSSFFGSDSSYRSFYEKLLSFDMESLPTMKSDQRNYASAKITINDVSRISKSGPADKYGNFPWASITESDFANLNRQFMVTRSYSFFGSVPIPGLASEKYNETDTIITVGKGIKNIGLGRIWVASGSNVEVSAIAELAHSAHWTPFFQWGKPIDHTATQAAINEMKRYGIGWRLAPGSPEPILTEDEPGRGLRLVNIPIEEEYLTKDGKEIPGRYDNGIPKKMASAEFMDLYVTPESFYLGDHPYFGTVLYNEGEAGGVGAMIFGLTGRTRAYPGVGKIAFKSDRSGYLYYDASFRPKEFELPLKSEGGKTDLLFNITTSTSDLKEALKSVVWDSRGDPCEARDVTTDPVCKAAYRQNTAPASTITTTSTPIPPAATLTTTPVSTTSSINSINPYASSLSITNRATLNTWITKNITSKKTTLTSTKYMIFIDSVIAKFNTLAKNTKNKNVLTKINYLIFELKQIKNNIEDEDSSFLEGYF